MKNADPGLAGAGRRSKLAFGWPQRQPPSQGSFHSVILILLRKQPLMGNPMEVGMA